MKRMRDMTTTYATKALPAALLLAAALMAASCGHDEAPRPDAVPSGPAVSVRTAPVQAQQGPDTSVPGIVRTRQRAALAPRIPASVIALPYREGERVEAGAIVVRLDDTALRSALAAAEAAAKTAATDLARLEGLVKRDAATPRERDEAMARAAAAEAAVQGAKDQLSYAALAAPFSGRVASRPANVGDVVSPGRTLIEIEGEGGFEIEASVDPGQVSAVRPGQIVPVDVDGLDAPIEGVVRSVSLAADPTTQRFMVRADLPTAPGLHSGLFARLRVPTNPSSIEEPSFSIPTAALVERGGLAGVYVVDQGRARLRWIAVGTARGDRMEVRAGLSPGERVILHPGSIADGAPVTDLAGSASEGGR